MSDHLGLVSMFSGFMIINMAVKNHVNQNSKFHFFLLVIESKMNVRSFDH